MNLESCRSSDLATTHRINAGPVALTPSGFTEAIDLVESLTRDGGHHFVCFCEANLLSNICRFPEVAEVVASADAVLADGVALTKLAGLHGHPLPERVPGPTFLLRACEYGLARGWRHFFYGGANGVAERLASVSQARFPGLHVAGTYCPPFRSLTDDEETDVKRMIQDARPHLLWVALGSPKQELWCADHVGKIDVPLMLPVGAAFDFHTGNRPWGPAWVRRIGMEWLWRTLTGGRRTFARNIRCVSTVACLLAREYVQHRILRMPP